MLQVTVSGSTRPTTCPLCRSELTVERARTCDGCGTSYHRACLADLGGCGTLGCAKRGQTFAPPVPRAARSGAAGGYLVAAGVVGATFLGLAGLSRFGAHLHPPRQVPTRSVTYSGPPPPAPVPATETRTHAPTTSSESAEAPAPSILTQERRRRRLEGLTRAAEDARADFVLLAMCEQVVRGGPRGAWGHGVIEVRLRHLDDDPVADARLWLREARAAGATEADVEGALQTGTMTRDHDDELLALIAGTDPSPFARGAFEPTLRAALEVTEREAASAEAARATAAQAYVAALEESIARDRLVTTIERLLGHPGTTVDVALWQGRLEGPDPHEVARAARRAFVAAGGDEVPDVRSPRYDRPFEARARDLLREARGVLAADDAAPTPTQRVRAALAERAAAPR